MYTFGLVSKASKSSPREAIHQVMVACLPATLAADAAAAEDVAADDAVVKLVVAAFDEG